MHEFVIPCLAAFAGCIGFSLLFQIRGKNLLFASLCGVFAWAVYLTVEHFFSLGVPSYLFAGAAAALYAEAAASLFKSPVTVYLIPGIIPTVPGLTIYRTMEACLLGNADVFFARGIETIKIGGAITLGIILVSSVVRIFRSSARRIKLRRIG